MGRTRLRRKGGKISQETGFGEQIGQRHGLSSLFTSTFYLNYDKEVIVDAAEVQHLTSDKGYSLIVGRSIDHKFLKIYTKVYYLDVSNQHIPKEHINTGTPTLPGLLLRKVNLDNIASLYKVALTHEICT